MARKRLQQSTADYLAIAFSPALIMLLVGSLVFFLLEVTYDGQYQGRVRWMLGWFVFATVLISRIGIEFGKSYAATYAGALALACGAFAFRFLEEYILGTIVLMGVVWWCVNQLTWDCTVIDDSVEVNSAGLLHQSGMDQPANEEIEEEEVETEKQRKRRLRREKLGIVDNTDASEQETNEEREFPKISEKQRSPGVWVVYFSLAALPLFGVGQAFLPQAGDSFREGFLYLWIYVASALGLFLTTSFLGLRRYLRQRRIKMPTSITAAWVTSGFVIVLLVLGISLLIPRPQASTSVTALLDHFDKEQSASNFAGRSNDAGEGVGRRVGRVDQNSQEQGDRASEEGEPSPAKGDGKQEGQSDQEGRSQGGEQPQDEGESQGSGQKKEGESQPQNDPQGQNSNQDNEGQQQARNQNQGEERRDNPEDGQRDSSSSSSTLRSASSAMSQLVQSFRWIIYAIFGGIVLYVLWKNRHDFAAGAREFWNSLMNFWANLFAGRSEKKQKSKVGNAITVADAGPMWKSFDEYENPFLTGIAHRMSPDALVLYTEEAFRAYARDAGLEAGEELTPVEIGQAVADRNPEWADAIRFLTTAHSRILYASRPPTSFDIAPLEALWTGLTRRTPQAVG